MEYQKIIKLLENTPNQPSKFSTIIKRLVKSIVIPLGLTAAASATDFHKKMFGSGTTTLIISMEEMNDITKIA